VQAAGVVLLYDETLLIVRGVGVLRRDGLRCAPRVAFAAVLIERHERRLVLASSGAEM
jgi:hypothetical protein